MGNGDTEAKVTAPVPAHESGEQQFVLLEDIDSIMQYTNVGPFPSFEDARRWLMENDFVSARYNEWERIGAGSLLIEGSEIEVGDLKATLCPLFGPKRVRIEER